MSEQAGIAPGRLIEVRLKLDRRKLGGSLPLESAHRPIGSGWYEGLVVSVSGSSARVRLSGGTAVQNPFVDIDLMANEWRLLYP